MNAHDRGREHGFAERLSYIKISETAFRRIGVMSAQKTYKLAEKQREYMAGWMENWQEPGSSLPASEDILTF